jgi:predicted CXXCH cytochrome family protein
MCSRDVEHGSRCPGGGRRAAWWLRLAAVLLAAVGGGSARADDSIVGSPHDLSFFGPGPIRAITEQQVCIFCHTPHNAQPQTPLWNRESPRTHYRIYTSSTTDARIDQPSGSSKMCLSCHDGSMALGLVVSRGATAPIVTTSRTIPPGSSDLTSDLSDDHPIGFRFDRTLALQDGQLHMPEVVTDLLPLGPHGEMHCSTCHDPHNNSLGDFLRETDSMSVLCTSCHDMHGWHHSSHAISAKPAPRRTVDPLEPLKYGTVRENGCLSCHRIHGAPMAERLLRHDREEDGCLNCHSGAVATHNIASVIGLSSAHDVRRYTDVHDPAETPFAMQRHVECADCHNPHAVQPNPVGQLRGTFGQLVKGPNLYVSGVSIAGQEIDNATHTYQICLKCHGDNIARPRTEVDRQIIQTNTRLEFQTYNPSFHPIGGPRRNPDVVSLIPPLRVGSVITCTDCHNSADARAFGGTGPNGPHGSRYEPLLVREYQTDDFTTESAQAYSLCYGCHSRDSILGDDSFPLHRRHIVDQNTPCSACHDAHGIYRGDGSNVNHSSLINFDLSIVEPVQTARGSVLEFVDRGRLSGTCTLTCHGLTHVEFPYGVAPTGAAATGQSLLRSPGR